MQKQEARPNTQYEVVIESESGSVDVWSGNINVNIIIQSKWVSRINNIG